MTIPYDRTMKLQLWVRDSGEFSGFAVYLDGSVMYQVADQDTKKYDIPRPDSATVVAIKFGGNDGGVSTIVNVANDQQVAVERQTGLQHSYFLEPA